MIHDAKTIDKAVLVAAGEKSRLDKRDTVCAELFPDKEAAEKSTKHDAKAIDTLQDKLWAEHKRALLVVLQGIDTSGKDGTVRGVFNKCGPLGVNVTPFGKPTEDELAHDFLWRIHMAAPKKGIIGVFNRSHYEDVLVVKVRKLAPAAVIEDRYDQINSFEQMLSESGVTILKFMLHISKDEQKRRLQARLEEADKHWKFNPSDLYDRTLWDDFQAAYETALDRCSTKCAPWRIIPSDKKWRRNAIVAAVVRATLEEMDPRYPTPDWKPGDFEVS